MKDLPDNHSETELITGLNEAGYAVEDINLMLITHGHPDHYLLGNFILQKKPAKVCAHIMDTDRICNPWSISKNVFEGRPRYAAMGMPLPMSSAQEYHKQAVLETFALSLKVDSPIAMDGPLSVMGETSDFISVKHSPGHSPGSICLLIGSEADEEKILISGDVILYPITPHPNDLVTYLRTLNELGQLERIALALPAHGKNIRDFYGRINSLKKHHRSRLEFTYRACRTQKNPWQIASMPRYFDVFVHPEKFNPMAGNEAFIHMRLLEMAGGLHRSKIEGNVHYFQNSGEKFDQVYGRIMEIVYDRRSTAL